MREQIFKKDNHPLRTSTVIFGHVIMGLQLVFRWTVDPQQSPSFLTVLPTITMVPGFTAFYNNGAMNLADESTVLNL